jgi:hypothetical protein
MKANTIKLKKGHVTLVEPGIIRFALNENIEWTLEDAKETHRANLELSNNGKFFIYMIAKHFFLPTKEAQAYITAKPRTDHRIASVFVVPNAGMKLLVTIFKRFFKSNSPTVIFKSEAEALKWMRTTYKEATQE